MNNNKKGKPNLPYLELFRQAGIDPITKLPIKMGSKKLLKNEIKKILRIVDEQDAVNRYVWYNLPAGITSQELERILYYRGQCIFFYFKELDSFFFMPYALDGTIDFYGRYNQVHPVPFANGTTKDEKARIKAQEDLLSTIRLKMLYTIPTDEKVYDNPEEYCIPLWDYTRQIGENIIPRQQVNDAIIDLEADCLPFMRTALLLGTGIRGMRVNTADEASNVKIAAQMAEDAALSSEPWIAIQGNQEFQDLNDKAVSKSEDYLMAMQSIDNIRLGTYGLENGGIFEKKAHVLEEENALNSSTNGIVLQDGLSIRQNFCDIVNALFGLGIECMPSEAAYGGDFNGDGYDIDESSEAYDGGSEDVQEDTEL